ncbi:hypothetical protein LINPERPRIM_LOCUS33704 [Linum perenne]
MFSPFGGWRQRLTVIPKLNNKKGHKETKEPWRELMCVVCCCCLFSSGGRRRQNEDEMREMREAYSRAFSIPSYLFE